jgi:hypothetical protein
MFVSEDGYVSGSIQVDKLDEIEAKSPEAKARLELLKAERDAGREQVAQDEERLAAAVYRQSPWLRTAEERAEAENKGLESSKRQRAEADQRAAERQRAEQQRQADIDKAAADQAKARKQG